MTALQLESQACLAKRPEPTTVLIVDDDRDHVEILAFRLTRLGYRVQVATTAEAAQRLLASARRPSLVLLDINLPDGSGLTLCQELADSLQWCDLPIIVISGLDEPEIIRECRRAGARFFLRKPYDPNVLLTLIDESIGGRSSSHAG